uniref:Replication factor C subunit 1 n=1 Tax=Lingulaulax polyedra TaxID=160621 RepID=A0A516AGA7_LINPO|nr:replication factor C subunit 1 [Lingulodinium polyedra]
MAPPVKADWAERYRPKHLGQVVGNTDQVRKLAEWLRDWDEVVLRGKVKEQPAAKEEWRTFKPIVENLNARAALISGPPGIGKTTTCSLVARCNKNYKLMEYNASDARGKTVIDSMSSSLAGNHTLKMTGGKGGAIERAVIIMDECDGMAGGGDKGGMQALINMIKNTKNPIICICNDRGDQQVRNLATHCFDIKFKRPENAAVAKRIKTLLDGEGRKADLSAIEAVVEACGHDIRQVINHLQFFGSASGGTEKDTQNMLSPFDACTKLLSNGEGSGKAIPLPKRLDMFYIDADMVPLMIQENYLRPLEKRGAGVEDDDLERCAQAAGLIATADSMSGNWEVSSSAAVIGSIYPSFLAATQEPLARPSFPAWLMRRGALSKSERLVQELHSRVKASTTCSRAALATSGYHDLLHRRLLRPLQTGAVKDCAVALMAYGLTREFFTDQAPALRAPLQMEDNYKKVEGKLKHQLLQELQALAQQHAPVKRKRGPDEEGGARSTRKKGRGGEDGRAEDAGEGAEPAEEEEGAGQARAKKRAKAKGRAGQESKCSLASWVPQRQAAAGEGDEEGGRSSARKPLLVLKYLDGHTCAVRRKVRMGDLLGPWTMF